MADVLFHPEAQEEYDEALAWYQSRSPNAALRFETEVERALTLIEANPGMFPKYDDEHRFAVLLRFPYSVVYQIQAGCVYVVAVAHGSRLPGYWERRA
ncbi:MAG: type II toxin-antitoxin system RelE/ParE family toxin [Planctomycetota bacterium]|nr:type II toxin-antitoxin system RelE/ParE family toxin [Planctomycetaceae bacterium]MDQ3330702.1 type II toxin-antitoxin system RelE/ParE family toxin [Planctomycetota bacterium]